MGNNPKAGARAPHPEASPGRKPRASAQNPLEGLLGPALLKASQAEFSLRSQLDVNSFSSLQSRKTPHTAKALAATNSIYEMQAAEQDPAARLSGPPLGLFCSGLCAARPGARWLLPQYKAEAGTGIRKIKNS